MKSVRSKLTNTKDLFCGSVACKGASEGERMFVVSCSATRNHGTPGVGDEVFHIPAALWFLHRLLASGAKSRCCFSLITTMAALLAAPIRTAAKVVGSGGIASTFSTSLHATPVYFCFVCAPVLHEKHLQYH